jgi:hypothetical protein
VACRKPQRIREKKEAEEAAIAKWMQENPQATAAQYIEEAKKIALAVQETYRHAR